MFVMTNMRTLLLCAFAFLTISAACGSSSSPKNDGAAGGATSSGNAGSGAGGTSGAAGTTGTAGTGAAGNAAAAGSSGAAGWGAQPVGAVCASTANCSQADGKAVCCVNTCVLDGQCPTGSTFLACTGAADCAKYGGGKVCCQPTVGGSVMRFCTKSSGCTGTVVP